MQKKGKAYMISHTHWDREWYLPYEEFRVKLVDLVDRLLDILEQDPEYRAFMMDGQTIVLEDYLKVKPHQEELIKKFIAEKRILIGPWYVLPDELLISGESHIRNYLAGSEICRRYHAGMKIGYLPDSFGHPSQMPQILKGLGLETIVFWRGASHEMDKTEFYWEAVDGSRVLAIHMPFGYGNSAKLDEDMEIIVPRIEKVCKDLLQCSHADTILLMNGSDHVLPQRNLTGIIKSLNHHLKDVHIEHSTLPAYIEEILPKLEELKTFSGELRHTDRTILLGGTLSTRMYLKQRNHEVEKGMERYTEPFCSLNWLMGGSYPEDFIKTGWRYILQNHPHDSICGCSIDEIHREMLMRFEKTRQLENELLSRAVQNIADHIDYPCGSEDAVITVYNPLQESRCDYLELDADFDRMLVRKVNFDKSVIDEYEEKIIHPPLPEGVEVYDEGGKQLPSVLLSAEKAYELKKSDDTLPEVYKVNRCRIGVIARNISPVGYSCLVVKKSERKIKGEVITGKTEQWIENEYFKVQLNEINGAVNILDKLSGRVYQNCNRFVDEGDAGDEYTYSYPETDCRFTLREGDFDTCIQVIEGIKSVMTVQGVLRLPEQLVEDRKTRSPRLADCPFKTEIRLFDGIRRIDITTELNNHAKDHRLRVLFPTGVRSEYSHALGQFCVEKRKAAAEFVENWEELPQSTHPQKGFVDVHDGVSGLAVATKGLQEFEIIEEGEQSIIAITLLRCVGWLSRPDLLTRKGNGGWTLPTPEAQCMGKYRYEYSVLPHEGDWSQSKIYIEAEQFVHPLYPVQSHEHKGALKKHFSMVEHMPDSWRLSAVKKAENENALIIRFYSIASEITEGEITLGIGVRKAEEVSLCEKWITDCRICGSSIKMVLRPGEIKTLKLFM